MSMDSRGPRTSADSSACTSRLALLGWDADWVTQFAPHAARGHVPARVLTEHRSRYVVATGDAEHDAALAGRFRHTTRADGWPAVGDWVALAASADDGARTIHAVLPRRTAFVRKAAAVDAPQVVAANVDVACVVAPLSAAPNARALERYVALAWESGAVPLIVLTKSDLCDDIDAAVRAARGVAPGVDVLAVAATTQAGIDALDRRLIPATTAVLLGPSGAGKSTLVNLLLGRERMTTRAVRADGKGRHTTTHRELVRLAGGALLIDTPGMRELGLWDAADGVDAAFGDVESLGRGCRFRDCAHGGEPGCAVQAAIDAGRLQADRLDAWRHLRRELAHLAARADPQVAAEARASNRVVHRAVKRMMRERRERGR